MCLRAIILNKTELQISYLITSSLHTYQGCQMVYFQAKNPNLGKFWRALEWKMLVYCMNIWNILRPFVIIYGHLI
jgi:hypothetical protein